MPSGNNPKLDQNTEYREAFLTALTTRLAAPSETWPTTRSWTSASLKRLFRETRQQLNAQGIRPVLTNKALLKWLTRISVAREVVADGESFYVFDLGPTGLIDPYELLMAARPKGVICYFSAIAFHSLTTQSVAHHHVAILKTPAAPPTTARTVIAKDTPIPAKPKLGQLLFSYGGTPYYATSRSSRLIPGIQTWAYGPRTNLRITAYEQTLLDTLDKPFHCGGPEVVFEAWQEAHQSVRLDEERLVGYLETMNFPATTRRVAVMLRLLNRVPGRALGDTLEKARAQIDHASEFAAISLLPFVNYQTLDKDWLVRTP